MRRRMMRGHNEPWTRTHRAGAARVVRRVARKAVPDQLGREKGAIVEWPPSNSLRAAPFDNTERWLAGRERYVVGHYRLAEALEGERAKLFSCDASL